ncbi:MAG: hypothetical protein ACE1ZQ_03355 [Ignavibacteriaceae bacterium]
MLTKTHITIFTFMDAKRYNNIKLGIGIGKAVFSFLLILLFVWLGYSLLLDNYISSYY